MVLTVLAPRSAICSTRVAESSLALTHRNGQRDEFSRQFSLLLEQNNSQMSIVKSFLDNETDGKVLLDSLVKSNDHLDSFNLHRGYPVISPYMRVFTMKEFIGDCQDLQAKKQHIREIHTDIYLRAVKRCLTDLKTIKISIYKQRLPAIKYVADEDNQLK